MNQPKMDIYQNTFTEKITKTEKFINDILNQIFILNKQYARYRYLVFNFFFFGVWALSAVFLHPLGNPDFYLLEALRQYNSPILNIVNQLLAVFFAWDVIMIVASLYLASFISRQLAAIYLADIFEIKDLSIAEKFISQAAFANTAVGAIHIENGQVRSDDHKSPTFRIGGPGSVEINLENATVFEKIDGTSTIVGPTTKEPYILEGFERIRSIIDLRDQTTNFSIYSRTRDGIPIEIKDVRLIFSVFRNNVSRTLNRPYPFTKEGLNWLVYNQSKGNWTTSLVGLVRGELVRYIAQHTLSEILAAPGDPEVKHQIQQQRMIARKSRINLKHSSRYKTHNLKYTKRKTNGPNYIPIYFWKFKHNKQIRYSKQFMTENLSFPSFSTRNQLSKIFYDEFNSSFRKRAQQRGVNLNWINVGSWHTPSNLVPEQHLEAWKIATENEVKSNPKVLREIRNQSKLKELSKILQQLPAQRFYEYQYQGLDKKEISHKLIQDYAAKLKSARDLFINKKGRVPRQIDTALAHIRKFQLQQYKDQGGFFIGE